MLAEAGDPEATGRMYALYVEDVSGYAHPVLDGRQNRLDAAVVRMVGAAPCPACPTIRCRGTPRKDNSVKTASFGTTKWTTISGTGHSRAAEEVARNRHAAPADTPVPR
ncbi:MAG: hypothetical protein JXR94_14465 [Candidatus Hydrogenedentes bacterium]|nr:hypothetical protein [Candidatus Hydrogenedentota bacterium]